MAKKFYSNVKVDTATTGTGAIEPGAPVDASYRAFADVASDGDEFTLLVKEGDDVMEIESTYQASPEQLSVDSVRYSVISGTPGTAQMNLNGVATVEVVQGGADIEQTATTGVTGVVERATLAEVRDPSVDSKFPAVKDLYDAAAEVALTSSANSVSWDMSSGIDFKIDTLGENTTIANPTNPTVGKKGRLRIVQDGTGSRTVAWGANFEFVGGAAPTASTAANAEDVFYYDVISSSRIVISSLLDIS